MRTLLTLSMAAAAVAMAGCQTWGPSWSEVSGERFYRASADTAPTLVNLIDGNGAFPNAPGQPIRIEPGRHRLTLTAPPPGANWPGGSDVVEFDLVAEPCKRYYVVARFDNRLGRGFKPVVEEVETIAGCAAGPAR
jgi:hypothetical protein